MEQFKIIWEQIGPWLSAGGATTVLTLILTLLTTKARKNKISLAAKDEQIEALIQQILDLKGIIFNLSEMFIIFFQTAKGIPLEARDKAETLIVNMRKDFGLKIKESVQQAIEIAKAKTLKEKEKALEQLEATKSEAAEKIEGLRNTVGEILSQEIKKN